MKKVLSSLAKIPLIILSKLPFPVLYLVADLLYAVLYHVIGYRKKVVRENLRNSFPQKSIAELLTIEKKFYHHLSDMILEVIKMSDMSRDSIEKRFYLTNPEEIGRFLNNGQPVMLVTAHYGNWEWGSLALSAAFPLPFIIVYKPINNKDFENMMNQTRSRFGAVMVAMKQTLRKIVSYKSQTFWAVFLGDQTPVKSEAHFFTTFLNQRTPVFLGIEKIARMTDSPVFFGQINKLRRGYYEATFHLITERPREMKEYEITEQHTQMLEKVITQRPEFWLWSHKRWKINH